MKKIILIVLLIIGIGGMYWYSQKNQPASKVKDFLNKVEEKVQNKIETKERTLKDLVKGGGSQNCNWKTEDSGVISEGQIWIDGNKFKQIIKTISAEDKKESSMVIASDGKYTYMWNDEMGKNGIKMANTSDQEQDYSSENGKVDWNKQYKYECSSAAVSASDMALPTGVEFQDLGAQIQKLQELQEGMKK